MPFFDQYPYTNFHNVNLDWVLQRVKEWGAKVEENNTKFENLESAYNEFIAKVTNLESELEKLEPWLSHNAKVALLNCFRNVYYDNRKGEELYNQLAIALGGNTYPIIEVVFNLDGHNIYTDDTLETVKSYITVKYYENVTSDGIIIPPSDYELMGELNEGLDVLTVVYGELTSLVTINVLNWHNIREWIYPSDIVTIAKGTLKAPASNNNYSIGIDNTEPYINQYRIILTTKGDCKRFVDNNNVPTIYYPIPVPANCNHFKVETTNNIEARVSFARFDSASNQYAILYGSAWGLHGIEGNFTSNDNLYIIPYCRVNANLDVFTTEPTNLKITLSEI